MTWRAPEVPVLLVLAACAPAPVSSAPAPTPSAAPALGGPTGPTVGDAASSTPATDPADPAAEPTDPGTTPGATSATTPGTTPGAEPAEVPCGDFPYADPLLAERAGYGASAVGGDPGDVVHVTTLADDGPGSLREAVEGGEGRWIVFDVDGTITLDDDLEVRSRTTVDGRGRDVTVDGHWELRDVHDVILTDLRLTRPSDDCDDGDDVITVSGSDCDDASTCTSHDLWFHHLELFEGGDGLLDLRGATGVTLSYTHLHDHVKAILAWQDALGGPATGMELSLHHNWFERITRRSPQFQYGRAHAWNNWIDQWYEYGSASLDEAWYLSEANVYEARPGSICLFPCPDPNPCGDDDFDVSKDGLVTEWDGRPGKVRSVADLATNGARLREREAASVFPSGVPYAYTAEPADAALTARLAAETGPRAATCP